MHTHTLTPHSVESVCCVGADLMGIVRVGGWRLQSPDALRDEVVTQGKTKQKTITRHHGHLRSRHPMDKALFTCHSDQLCTTVPGWQLPRREGRSPYLHHASAFGFLLLLLLLVKKVTVTSSDCDVMTVTVQCPLSCTLTHRSRGFLKAAEHMEQARTRKICIHTRAVSHAHRLFDRMADKGS
jgi:hypothetical protein